MSLDETWWHIKKLLFFSSSFPNSNNMILSSILDIQNFTYLTKAHFNTLWIAAGFICFWEIIFPTYLSLPAKRGFHVRSKLVFQLVYWPHELAPGLLMFSVVQPPSLPSYPRTWFKQREIRIFNMVSPKSCRSYVKLVSTRGDNWGGPAGFRLG